MHHKIPFRNFTDRDDANNLNNLVSLCPSCHRQAEQNVQMRSGLAGLATVLGHLAPLYLMTDSRDLGVFTDPAWAAAEGMPSVVLYDQVPAGIGFSQKLFEMQETLLASAEKRALRLGEAEIAPRISDLPSIAASTGGKLELEYGMEAATEAQVVERLIGDC